MLAVFETATGAVSTALAVQQQLEAQSAGLPVEFRMRFRIGVHLGDVIEKRDGTVYGDGVNIAARLEGLADPGGITVSDAVRGAVGNRLAVRFDDQGEQQVKNISEPVRAFRIGSASPAAARTGTSWPRRLAGSLERWRWPAAAILAVTLVAITAWTWPSLWRAETTDLSAPLLSVAVMPFTSTSGDPADNAFADALTQGLKTALGQWRMAKVAVHRSNASGMLDARAVARELGVRHVVVGDIRRDGARFTLTARLLDDNGAQAWSDEIDVPGSGDAQAASLLRIRLSRRIRSALYDAEIRYLSTHATARTPIEQVLRGDAAWGSQGVGSAAIRAARKFYGKALELDPKFLPALISEAWAVNAEFEEGMANDRDRVAQAIDSLSVKAIGIDPRDAQAWTVRSVAFAWQGRWDEALAANTRAQDLDPSNLELGSIRAFFLISMGLPAEAVALEERLMAMDPPGSAHMFRHLCQGHLLLGRYDAAVPACERAGALDTWWFDQIFLVAAYAQRGDTAKAGIATQQLLRGQPEFTIARFMQKRRSETAAYVQQMETHVLPGLRKAGVPEQ